MISSPGLNHRYAPVRNTDKDIGEQDAPDAAPIPPTSSTPGRKIWVWLETIWPLVLHFVGAIGIAALLIYYVDDSNFNIRERRPTVTLANGTAIRTDRFSPLQSDINTILSAALVVLRLVLASWAGPLCWRTLFFLLEKTGLRRRELNWLLSYGVFPLSTHLRHACIIFIAGILTSTLCAQSSSPILTGSITWAPSSVSLGDQSDAFIYDSRASSYSRYWQPYARLNEPYVQTRVAVKATGYATQAWGRDSDNGVFKRVLPSAGWLNTNSTIANVSLPYFQVTALEWISDPPAHNLTRAVVSAAGLEQQVETQFTQTPGMLAMLPQSWQLKLSRDVSPNPVEPSPRLPLPVIVSETGILILFTGLRYTGEQRTCAQINGRISNSFPPNMGFDDTNNECYAFARVTYNAGVGACTNCRLSSPSVVQNDSEIPLQPDTMTTEALRIMPNTTINLVLMNSSIPSPWQDVDSYVKEVLSRSYSGSWSALHDVLSFSDAPSLVSRAYPTLPSLQAQLDLRRVYAWLALQLLVTVTGIFFMWLQSESKYALFGDTTMVAFDLDTTNAPKADSSDESKVKNMLKVEPKDGGWRVVGDPPVSANNSVTSRFSLGCGSLRTVWMKIFVCEKDGT